ncbi:MAG: cell division protein FtsZ [Chloroflexi bacterium]|nr:cell division protein FtsZ [Chloroflexota bacterium]|tara:strand:+ start:870 stop:1913 length:1044 start_codon:yes stop_codon:yes gene_type:complete
MKTSLVKIKIIGVGGGGGNAVNRMSKNLPISNSLLAINTDIQALENIKNVQTFAIGPNTTKGMGTGGNPDIGKKSIEESYKQIEELIIGNDMVFITAGMGGGTGTGASSIIAEICKKNQILTIGIVTLPFTFEGFERRKIALNGLKKLNQKLDSIITIDNDTLLPAFNESTSLIKSFEKVDEILEQGVKGITDVINLPGLINVDFADLKSIIKNGGKSLMSVGYGDGKNAAINSIESALSNPLINETIAEAKGILFYIKAGNDISLGQVHQIANKIKELTINNPKIMFGVVREKNMKRKVNITLIATGISKTKNKTNNEILKLDNKDLIYNFNKKVSERPEQIAINI